MRRSGIRIVPPQLLLLCWLAGSALGSSLSLTTKEPLRLEPGAAPGSLIVDVVDITPAPLPSDNLAAWQLVLQIIPDVGATGTVGIDSTALPSNYVLSGINFGLTSSITTQATPNDSVFAFDFNFPFSGGAPVPLAPGAGLLQLNLIASADARGDFQLMAKPGLGVSEWSGASDIDVAREFENLTGVTENVAIGLVTIGPVAPIPGDCNGDGVVDAVDLECICSAESGTLTDVLGATGLLRGDFDADGSVELVDFLRLSVNFGQVVERYTDGDADCDGEVTFVDFLLFVGNFGQRSTTVVAVPEPRASALLSLGGLLLIGRLRSNSRPAHFPLFWKRNRCLTNNPKCRRSRPLLVAEAAWRAHDKTS